MPEAAGRDPDEPAPVAPARRHRQPSLFGVDVTDPRPQDLTGLLAGPGQLSRMGGTARVSVTVDAAWRVHVLIDELVRRQLPANWESTDEGGYIVRSAYTVKLAPLAGQWSGDGTAHAKVAPVPLHVNGPALRLWVAAAGRLSEDGYLLRLGAGDETCWPTVGAALHAVGVPAALLTAGGPGPAYRVTGRRRLARLAELVGSPPAAAPLGAWPTPD